MINDFLISQTIVQPGERVLKRQLQEGLGDERTKRLKIAVGKEPTVALLRAEYFASPTLVSSPCWSSQGSCRLVLSDIFCGVE